ncbi:MAG: hypothetical protein KatS3mg105_3084 [Gemmatales bacterium]|nr:MAG: hypothetical protein KatS3mg105_3084 [Gemmatales bacterium]
MKAEHRKELQTNILADRVGKWVKDIKDNPQASSIGVLVLVALTLVLFTAWMRAKSSRPHSSLWVEVTRDAYSGDANMAIRGLADVARRGPASFPGRTARLQQARLLLNKGLENIASRNRDQAVQNLEEARRLFRDVLVKECKDNPLLLQQALFGAAQAEEALAGVPLGDDSEKSRGDLNAALRLYREVARRFPDGVWGKKAVERANEIDTHFKEIQRFYAEMRESLAARKTPGA